VNRKPRSWIVRAGNTITVQLSGRTSGKNTCQTWSRVFSDRNANVSSVASYRRISKAQPKPAVSEKRAKFTPLPIPPWRLVDMDNRASFYRSHKRAAHLMRHGARIGNHEGEVKYDPAFSPTPLPVS